MSVRSPEQPARTEKRHEPRIPCDRIPARVRVESKILPAEILDISLSGIRVGVRALLTEGAEIAIYFDHMIVIGNVRYCRQVEDGFFHAGVRIEDVLRAAPAIH